MFVTTKPREQTAIEYVSLVGSLGIHFVVESLQLLPWTGSPAQTSVRIWLGFGPIALSLINVHQGIHAVHSSCPEVTHNIVHELTLTPFCVLSLLESNVVSPKWLTEVICRGTESNKSSILEQNFELPDTSSYLPAVSAAIPSALSSTDFWITGTSRRGVLDSYRFIIFTGNSENVEDLQSIISVSGGGYELFPVDSGRIRLHRRLSADKDKRQKVIVVDDEVKTSVSPDTWNELIDEAKSSVSFLPSFFSPAEPSYKVRVNVLQPRKGFRNYCRWRALCFKPLHRFAPIPFDISPFTI